MLPNLPDTASGLLADPNPVMRAMLKAAAAIRGKKEWSGGDIELSEKDEENLILAAGDRMAGYNILNPGLAPHKAGECLKRLNTPWLERFLG